MDAEQIAITLTEHENRIKVSEHRIDDLEEFQKGQQQLIVSVNRLANNMEGMLTEQKEQGKRLKQLETEPVKQYSSSKKAFFNALLGALGSALGIGVIGLLYIGASGI